ncbi:MULTISPECIES: ATP-binding protein [unclassified Frankia]|uniref:ATP-binding protein n=1 Tax=unclassified Frankia TaxID=2632575 RepID=UPI002AD2747C|nr:MULTISPECIES: ATP-binding protein [unclassified Frankia]
MANLQRDVDEALVRLRRARTDLQAIEVKAAASGLPKSVAETVSAFANAQGGLLILGLDEARGFQSVAIDAPKVASDLASACADQLDPPIRPEIDIVAVDGRPVVVARVDELPTDRKPCHLRTRGIDRGSYLRTHDGDRALTSYEVHVMVASRGQPRDDTFPVPDAGLDDLDSDLVAALLRRLRETRGPVFAKASDDEALRLVRVIVDTEDGAKPTLAGLLALGRYPQRFYPQLDVTFVAYPTVNGEPLQDGTRFLDNQSVDGPIPTMVATALTAMRRNMKRRSVIVGLGRQDQWEYPEEAIREIVANALMHRDYHPLAHGTQVRIGLYPDRLEVSSPGGLHGPIAREDLLAESVSSSRNALLSKLLEDVEIPGTNRTVCENRGSGLLATAAALRSAGIEPPNLVDNVREFRVVIQNHGLLDDDAVGWLSTIDTVALTDRQRLGLAFLRRNATITNHQYRTLTGCDSLTATKDLTGMALRGLLDKRSDRRWTVWRLATDLTGVEAPDLAQPSPYPDATGTVSTARRSRSEGRREEIRALLANGPRSAHEMAAELALTAEGVLRWLRRMETDGEIRTTATSRNSRLNRWELIEYS